MPATVNGTPSTISHYTTTGQPGYDNANKTVNLDSRIVNGSANHGTEYRITVNFKQNYTYKITITAVRIMSTQTGADVLLRVDLNNGGTGGNNQCTGTGSIDANGSGGFKLSQPVFSSTFSTGTGSDYVFDYPSLSADQSYLMIAAIPPSASVSQTILIRRIKIEETPPPVSFTIPGTTTFACGSTSAINFAVTNVYSTAGVTNYTWNLGATPNGWLYNGAAAPATVSTGLTSTIALTPVCNTVPKNVSATVTANNTPYNTNTSAVSVTQPTMAINGSSSICSGSSPYSVTGLPCSASITWTVSPTGIVTPNTSTNASPTLTKVGNGNITLSASIIACGVTTTPTALPIKVGAFTSADYTLTGNNGSPYFCPNTNVSYALSGGAAGSNYVWSIPTGWTTLYNGGSYATFKTQSSSTPATGNVSVSFSQPCGGTTVTKSAFVIFNTSCSANSPYSVTPNPASTTITISCISLATYCNISAVQITNTYGTVLSSQTWSNTNQTVQMPVGFLQNGTYLARIYNGTQWYTNQFIKN